MKDRPNIAPLSQDDPRLTQVAASITALRRQGAVTAAQVAPAAAHLADLPEALEAALAAVRGARS